MDRRAMLERATARQTRFDIAVIGGGANGAGIALDAASRGLSVVLLERGDFGCGTSSRSSKLIHGGIRYLAFGQFGLVREALRERTALVHNASALVRPLSFLIPARNRYELLKFRAGVKLYDLLAGAAALGKSACLEADAVRAAAPGLMANDYIGAVRYTDAQFDDARLLVDIIKAAVAHGASALNYCEAIALHKHANGSLKGVAFIDQQSGETHTLSASRVINAAGPLADEVRRLDVPNAPHSITPSQGAHVVVPARFLASDDAIVFPQAPGDRIMFAIPWHGYLLLGTTDVEVAPSREAPLPLRSEIDMILEVAHGFLDPAPTRADVLSVFAGQRPLAGAPLGDDTARVSREHALQESASGLITVSGGKWTTYRLVAEQCVDFATASKRARSDPGTRNIGIAQAARGVRAAFVAYGGDAPRLEALVRDNPELAAPLHPDLPYLAAHYVWAARHEMSHHVRDALAYRTRAMFLHARAAAQMARGGGTPDGARARARRGMDKPGDR